MALLKDYISYYLNSYPESIPKKQVPKEVDQIVQTFFDAKKRYSAKVVRHVWVDSDLYSKELADLTEKKFTGIIHIFKNNKHEGSESFFEGRRHATFGPSIIYYDNNRQFIERHSLFGFFVDSSKKETLEKETLKGFEEQGILWDFLNNEVVVQKLLRELANDKKTEVVEVDSNYNEVELFEKLEKLGFNGVLRVVSSDKKIIKEFFFMGGKIHNFLGPARVDLVNATSVSSCSSLEYHYFAGFPILKEKWEKLTAKPEYQQFKKEFATFSFPYTQHIEKKNIKTIEDIEKEFLKRENMKSIPDVTEMIPKKLPKTLGQLAAETTNQKTIHVKDTNPPLVNFTGEVICHDSITGKVTKFYYLQNGILDRTDGPACIFLDENEKVQSMEWYRNGKKINKEIEKIIAEQLKGEINGKKAPYIISTESEPNSHNIPDHYKKWGYTGYVIKVSNNGFVIRVLAFRNGKEIALNKAHIVINGTQYSLEESRRIKSFLTEIFPEYKDMGMKAFLETLQFKDILTDPKVLEYIYNVELEKPITLVDDVITVDVDSFSVPEENFTGIVRKTKKIEGSGSVMIAKELYYYKGKLHGIDAPAVNNLLESHKSQNYVCGFSLSETEMKDFLEVYSKFKKTKEKNDPLPIAKIVEKVNVILNEEKKLPLTIPTPVVGEENTVKTESAYGNVFKARPSPYQGLSGQIVKEIDKEILKEMLEAIETGKNRTIVKKINLELKKEKKKEKNKKMDMSNVKDEMRQAALRGVIRRIRETLVVAVAELLSKDLKDDSARATVVEILKTPYGGALLSLAVGAVVPVVAQQVPEEYAKYVEEVGEELRISGGADIVYELSGVMAQMASGLFSQVKSSLDTLKAYDEKHEAKLRIETQTGEDAQKRHEQDHHTVPVDDLKAKLTAAK